MSRHTICGVCVTSQVYDLAADAAFAYEKGRHEKKIVRHILSQLDRESLGAMAKAAGPAEFMTDGQGFVTEETGGRPLPATNGEI